MDLWELTPSEEAALDSAYWDAPESDDEPDPDDDPDD